MWSTIHFRAMRFTGTRLSRGLLLSAAIALPTVGVASSAAQVAVTDLHGKQCHSVASSSRGSTRECAGVRGYALLVYDDDDRTSIDVIAPKGAVYPLLFWDVVTPGYAVIGQKAEWLLGTRKGRPAPTALTVRLTRLDLHDTRDLIAVARIDGDGACVVFKADAAAPGADERAARAARNHASKCLGAWQEE